ncbi:MAG: hypothetical protein ACFE8G_05860 [Candidatus Hermodarchaeota archaeon]
MVEEKLYNLTEKKEDNLELKWNFIESQPVKSIDIIIDHISLDIVNILKRNRI